MAATVAERLTSVKRASDGMPFEVNHRVSFVDPQSGLYTDGVVVSFASSTAVEVGYAGSGWSDPKYNKIVSIDTLLSSLTKSTRTGASKKSSSSTSSTAPSAASATATSAVVKGEPVEEEAQKMSHGLSTCASLESLASVASSRPKLTHRTSPTTSPLREVKEVKTEEHGEPPCHESLATTSLDVHEASAALAMLQHALPPKPKPSQSCEVCGRGGGRPMLICRKCRKGVHKGCLASPNPQSGAAHVCPKCKAASASPNFNPTSDPETPARTLLRTEDSNEAPQASDTATKPPKRPTGLHLLFSVLFDKKENKSSSSVPSGSGANKKPSSSVSREDGAHRSHHAQSNKRKRAPSPPAPEGRKPHELSSFNRAQAFLLRNPHDPAGLSGLSHPKPPRTSSSSPAPTSNDRSNVPQQRTSRWSTASSAQRKPGAQTTSTNTTTTTTTAATERATRPLPPPPPPSITTSTHTQTHTRTQTDAPIPAQQRPPSSSSAAWSEEERWNAARAMMGIRKNPGKSGDADVKLVVPPSFTSAHGASSSSSPRVAPMGETQARNADAAVRGSGGDAGDGTQGQGLLRHQQQQQLLQRRPMHEAPYAHQGLGARVEMEEDVSEAGSERDMTTYDLHMSALLTQRRLEQRRIAVEQQRQQQQQQHQQQQEATLARLQRACVGMDERRARDTQQEDAVQAFLRHHHQHHQQQRQQHQQRHHYQQQQQRQERGQGPVFSSLVRVKTPDESPRHRRAISSSSSSSSSSHERTRHDTTLSPSSSSPSFMSTPCANFDPAMHHHLTSQLHEDQRRQTQQLRDIERAAASSVQALAAYRALKAATTLHGPYEHGIDVLRGLKGVDAKAVLQGLASGGQSNSPFLASSAKQQAPRGPMRPNFRFSLVREHKRQQTSASAVGDDNHEPSAASYKKFKWAGAF